MNITQIEVWRPVSIAKFSSSYEVSNMGRVRSVDRCSIDKNGRRIIWQGQLIRPTLSGNTSGKRRYLHVIMSAHGSKSGALVHRLVALAFIPNPLNLPEVNHIDTVKTNNAATNLEWMTQAANREHARRHGLLVPPPDQTKLSDSDVAEVRRLFRSGMKQTAIARSFDVSPGLVCLIVNGHHRPATPHQSES